MKILFSLDGCPFCNTAGLAILAANTNLPGSKRVLPLPTFPVEINGKALGDPRLGVLAKYNNTESIQEWGFPTLWIDREGIVKEWGVTKRGRVGRVLVHSAYSHNHYKAFIQRLLL